MRAGLLSAFRTASPSLSSVVRPTSTFGGSTAVLLDTNPASHVCPPFMVCPDSVLKQRWDWLVILMVLFNAIMVPVELAFAPPFASTQAFVALDVGVTLLFVVDIGVSLLTGLRGRWGHVEYNRRAVFVNYARGMLVVDVLAVFPFELVAPGAGITFANLLKLPRLLRLGRLTKKIETLAAATALRIVSLLLLFWLLAHWSACLWWFLGVQCHAAPDVCHADVVWITEHFEAPPEDIPLTAGYVSAALFALATLTTVGFGGMAPTNAFERTFACGVLVLSAAIYAVIFGNMAVQIKKWDEGKLRFNRTLKSLKEFLKLHSISTHLTRKATAYLNAFWSISGGLDPHDTLSTLPAHVKADVLMAVHQRFITMVPMFRNAEPAFVRVVVTKLRPQVGLAGDYILRRGEVARTLYFVYRGSVVRVSKKRRLLLREGSFFGEASILEGTTGVFTKRSETSVKAATKVWLYTLSKDAFQGVLAEFPEYRRQLRNLGQGRFDVARIATKLRNSLPEAIVPEGAALPDHGSAMGSLGEGFETMSTASAYLPSPPPRRSSHRASWSSSAPPVKLRPLRHRRRSIEVALHEMGVGSASNRRLHSLASHIEVVEEAKSSEVARSRRSSSVAIGSLYSRVKEEAKEWVDTHVVHSRGMSDRRARRSRLPVVAAVLIQKTWRHRGMLDELATNSHTTCYVGSIATAAKQAHAVFLLSVAPWRVRLRRLLADAKKLKEEKRRLSSHGRVQMARAQIKELATSTKQMQLGAEARLANVCRAQDDLMAVVRQLEQAMKDKAARMRSAC